MKNFFKKAFVAVGVMASALALSSVAIFASTFTQNGYVPASTDEFGADKTLLNNDYATVVDVKGLTYSANENTINETSYVGYVKTGGSSTNTTYGSTTIRPLVSITPKQDVTLYADYSTSKGKTFYVLKSDGTAVFTENAADGRVTDTIQIELSSGTTYYMGAAGSDAYLYGVYFATASTNPSVTIKEDSVVIAPNSQKSVTATLKNTGDAVIDWSITANDNISITSLENTVTIYANENATSTDTATVTAKVTVGGVEYADSFTVRINSFKVDYDMANGLNQNSDLYTLSNFQSEALAPKDSPVYLSDGTTETTFTKAAVGSGSSATVTFNLKKGDSVELYYTFTDGKFATESQSKKAKLQLSINDAEATQDAEINAKDNYAYLRTITATENGTYVVGTSTNRLAIYGFNYKPKVSEHLETISGLNVSDGLVATAKYTKVGNKHYLVLDFEKNEALEDANELTYSAGENNIPISKLYKGVQFDTAGDDIIQEAGHLYYGFKFVDSETYDSLDASISIAN